MRTLDFTDMKPRLRISMFWTVSVGMVAACTTYALVASEQTATAPSPVLATHGMGGTPNWPAFNPAAAGNGEASFVTAAEASVHAVVHVQTASIVPDASNPWLSMLGMTTGRVAQGSGSGVILEEDGLIVTNHHVIEGAREVRVNLSDGTSYEAELLGSDPSTDLAILQIHPTSQLHALSLGNSDDVRVGEWVLAVGNPLNLTSTVTAGIVSAKGRNIRLLAPDATREVYPVESFIQTDAAVNPGNSGGALVNLSGELIGINAAIASQTGSYAGYSFAIPSSIVAKVVRDLKEFGRVQRAYLGVQVDPQATGIRVASTSAGGGAESAGLEPGDRILSVNGIAVNSFPSLQEQLSKHRPGDDVNVQIRRNGSAQNVNVTLTDRHGDTHTPPARNPRDAPQESSEASTKRRPSLQSDWGVRFQDLTPEDCERLQVRGGVVTVEVLPGEWKRQGLARGFILLRVDGVPIESVADVERIVLRAAESGEQGVLVEGMYANGRRAYAGVAVPQGRAQSHK